MDIKSLIRPNILALAPYSTARDEYQGGEIGVFLDANESPYETGLNRYPDPHLKLIKERLSGIKKVREEQIFIGNGSDEAIDLIFRVFCAPAADNVVMIAPSYGMYKVSAEINDIAVREVLLEADYSFSVDKLLAATDSHTKAIFLCSPNNPTANILDRREIERLIDSFEGIVVVDEAYVDFCTDYRSFTADLDRFPNLVVLQTLSKAWGLAGVRFGMAFASDLIVGVMNKVKYPYNINILTQNLVYEKLLDYPKIEAQCREIIAERERLLIEFRGINLIKKIFPTDANFILIKVDDANNLYNYLVERGVIVRNRNSVVLCEGCLRITVGTASENSELLKLLKEYE